MSKTTAIFHFSNRETLDPKRRPAWRLWQIACPQWADLDPFALISPDQFLPEGPPELTSREYAKAVKQVQSLGEADSTLRTDEQTEIAEYWHYGPRTPPGHWNDIATDIAQAEGLSLTETAQLLATLNVAEADAIIAAWDAKYFYDTWRPVTAIREDGQLESLGFRRPRLAAASGHAELPGICLGPFHDLRSGR